MSDQTENKVKETEKKPLYTITGAPHVKTGESVKLIMWTVVAALIPSAVYAGYIFGLNAIVIMAASVAAAMIAEAVMQVLLKKPVTVFDGSAVITGLLVAMNVPPEAPVWMPVIGTFFAIIIAKQLFGGLGFNIFNPALAARAFMMASWPVHMTTKWHKFDGNTVLSSDIKNTTGLAQPVFDALTQATPLTAFKEGPRLLLDNNVRIDQLYDVLFGTGMFKSLFIGNVGGVIGETSALLLLAGGIILLVRKVISWHIPVVYIGTVGFISYIYYIATGNQYAQFITLFHVLSGGLFLGAFFMATDMVTSPITKKGMMIFAAGCGIITFIIRIWGGYPEGVSYAILLMNAVVPLIDRFVKPKVFGTEKVK